MNCFFPNVINKWNKLHIKIRNTTPHDAGFPVWVWLVREHFGQNDQKPAQKLQNQKFGGKTVGGHGETSQFFNSPRPSTRKNPAMPVKTIYKFYLSITFWYI